MEKYSNQKKNLSGWPEEQKGRGKGKNQGTRG